MKKILTSILALSFIFSPLFSFAQTVTSNTSGSYQDGASGAGTSNSSLPSTPQSAGQYPTQTTTNNSGSTGGATTIQAAGANSQANSTGNSSGNSQAGSIAAGAGSCALSSTIASAITTNLSNVIDKATGLQDVPTSNPTSDPRTAASTAAHTGLVIGGVYTGISWDAIAYCIGNAAIQYISDSTINWINSGFDGNPAFVNNPDQFFTDIADNQANAFITTLASTPIAPQVVTAVTHAIVSDYNAGSNAALGQHNTTYAWNAQQNQAYNQFVSGSPNGFNLNTFAAVSQNPYNNYIGAQWIAQEQLTSQIAYQEGLQQQQLSQNGGYLGSKQCTTTNGIQTCNTTVTGSDIQKAGQDSRNLANLRLVASSKFDEVITALVQKLIQTSLNKLLTPSSGQ